MAQEARIKSNETNLSTLEGVCTEIKGIGEKNGIRLKGSTSSSYKKDESGYSQIAMWTGDKHLR